MGFIYFKVQISFLSFLNFKSIFQDEIVKEEIRAAYEKVASTGIKLDK